jgi:hypothetical protein
MWQKSGERKLGTSTFVTFTDIIEMNGNQHQGHCKHAIHGRAYPTFLFHGCVMTSPPLDRLMIREHTY